MVGFDTWRESSGRQRASLLLIAVIAIGWGQPIGPSELMAAARKDDERALRRLRDMGRRGNVDAQLFLALHFHQHAPKQEEAVYWYVRADSPIKSLADTAGKTIAFSTKGSSTDGVVTAFMREQKLNAGHVARQRLSVLQGERRRGGRHGAQSRQRGASSVQSTVRGGES